MRVKDAPSPHPVVSSCFALVCHRFLFCFVLFRSFFFGRCGLEIECPQKKSSRKVCVCVHTAVKRDSMTTPLTNEPTRNCHPLSVRHAGFWLLLDGSQTYPTISHRRTYIHNGWPGQPRNPQQAGVEGFELSNC